MKTGSVRSHVASNGARRDRIQREPVAGNAAEGVAIEQLTREFLACRIQLQRVVFSRIKCWESAQELTQECFMRAYRARQTFSGRATVSTWLTRIAINLAYDKLRQRKHHVISMEEVSVARSVAMLSIHGGTPEETAAFREQVELAWKLAGKLSPALQAVLELRYRRDFSEMEISAQTGLSITAVKTRLNRARVQLRELAEAGVSPCRKTNARKSLR